ncbi:hypothetical protein [Nocardia sp. CNY236]|uniref:hypothetical protein n=1 Tax=Nocardia sp. CNY236 TaxID=1169152 RepID=UPI00048F5AF0|nr:hypothetical protein [Nocardia sp. CNY236]
MRSKATGAEESDYLDRHFSHQVGLSPGDVSDSPTWNAYIKPLVDPFVDTRGDFRYCDEDEFHELVWEVWTDHGVDNDVTIEHEALLSTGTSARRGSRIDFLICYDNLHRVGVEIKCAGRWSPEGVQEQLVRYAETGQINTILLLTADPDLTDIDWPRDLGVPLFIVQLTGRRGRL